MIALAAALLVGCGGAAVQAQNGSQLFVPGPGPACLYRAWAARRPAALALDVHGVDTAGRLEVAVLRGGRVSVAGSNTVFFGSTQRTTRWSERCKGLTRRSYGVVVRGCPQGDYLLSPPGAPQVANDRF